MHIPRILLTAGASGSGKTLLTCGLLQVLKNRGLKVMSFKCGPDYIDPMFHAQVIGTPSRNLDTFFTGQEGTQELLAKNGAGCHVAVLEGVMGYYDGLGGISTDASAYDVAKATDTPAVLIVNCKGMSVSILPYIKGFLEFREDSHIRGVILNQMTPMLYPRVKAMIEDELHIEVYGYVPKLTDCVLESRHLGLVLPNEVAELQEKLHKLADVLEDTLDVDKLLELAKRSGKLQETRSNSGGSAKTTSDEGVGAVGFETLNEDLDFSTCSGNKSHVAAESIRIAVARDEAFCFIYEDNLQLLRDMGAELVEFSPIHDEALPEHVQGLLLYGGYPELYARELGENVSMRDSIHNVIEQGLPCIAECGGFMYLMDSLESMEYEKFPMAGIFRGNAFRTEKLSRFGYVTLTGGTVFGEQVGDIPAHEFHYFDTTDNGDTFTAKKPLSKRAWDCIHSTPTLFAGFPHIHFYGNKKVAAVFLKACGKFGQPGNL